jgi:hypothetical protein
VARLVLLAGQLAIHLQRPKLRSLVYIHDDIHVGLYHHIIAVDWEDA